MRNSPGSTTQSRFASLQNAKAALGRSNCTRLDSPGSRATLPLTSRIQEFPAGESRKRRTSSRRDKDLLFLPVSFAPAIGRFAARRLRGRLRGRLLAQEAWWQRSWSAYYCRATCAFSIDIGGLSKLRDRENFHWLIQSTHLLRGKFLKGQPASQLTPRSLAQEDRCPEQFGEVFDSRCKIYRASDSGIFEALRRSDAADDSRSRVNAHSDRQSWFSFEGQIAVKSLEGAEHVASQPPGQRRHDQPRCRQRQRARETRRPGIY